MGLSCIPWMVSLPYQPATSLCRDSNIPVVAVLTTAGNFLRYLCRRLGSTLPEDAGAFCSYGPARMDIRRYYIPLHTRHFMDSLTYVSWILLDIPSRSCMGPSTYLGFSQTRMRRLRVPRLPPLGGFPPEGLPALCLRDPQYGGPQSQTVFSS